MKGPNDISFFSICIFYFFHVIIIFILEIFYLLFLVFLLFIFPSLSPGFMLSLRSVPFTSLTNR